MGLIVALGKDGKAQGELFWDDGESIGNIPSRSSCLFIILMLANTIICFRVRVRFHSRLKNQKRKLFK